MNNELQHHGILGMKWGVRRYQNEDGSLTPAGEKRYDDGNANDKKEAKRMAREEKRYERGKQLKETYGKITEKDLRNSIFIKDAKMFLSGFALTGGLVAIDHYFDKPAAMVAARAVQPLTYAGMAFATANGIRDIRSLRTYNNSGRK